MATEQEILQFIREDPQAAQVLVNLMELGIDSDQALRILAQSDDQFQRQLEFDRWRIGEQLNNALAIARTSESGATRRAAMQKAATLEAARIDAEARIKAAQIDAGARIKTVAMQVAAQLREIVATETARPVDWVKQIAMLGGVPEAQAPTTGAREFVRSPMPGVAQPTGPLAGVPAYSVAQPQALPATLTGEGDQAWQAFRSGMLGRPVATVGEAGPELITQRGRQLNVVPIGRRRLGGIGALPRMQGGGTIRYPWEASTVGEPGGVGPVAASYRYVRPTATPPAAIGRMGVPNRPAGIFSGNVPYVRSVLGRPTRQTSRYLSPEARTWLRDQGFNIAGEVNAPPGAWMPSRPSYSDWLAYQQENPEATYGEWRRQQARAVRVPAPTYGVPALQAGGSIAPTAPWRMSPRQRERWGSSGWARPTPTGTQETPAGRMSMEEWGEKLWGAWPAFQAGTLSRSPAALKGMTIEKWPSEMNLKEFLSQPTQVQDAQLAAWRAAGRIAGETQEEMWRSAMQEMQAASFVGAQRPMTVYG